MKRKRFSATSSTQPKGLLTMVKSCVLNSMGEVPIKLVDAKSAATTVSQGGQFGGDIVVIHHNNQVNPGYLPELSDLALLPATLKVAVKWIIANHGGEGGIGCEKIIPESITSLLAGSATPTIQTHILTKGTNSIHFNSYNDYNHLFLTPKCCKIKQMSISSILHNSEILDGKKIKINLSVESNADVKAGSIQGRNKWVVWNCKSMAKNTFVQEFHTMVELNMTDVVVLTETRVSIHMARVISHGIFPYAVYGTSKTALDGGHAIVVFRKENSLELIDSFNNSKMWRSLN